MAHDAHHARVLEDYYAAREAYVIQREAITIGYLTEMREFHLHTPPPRLADFLKLHSHKEY